MRTRMAGVAGIVAVLGAWYAMVGAARGGEPAEAFLNSLRERGYYDAALDYLDQMETSPLAPVAFKYVIDYERGATRIAAAGSEPDPKARERLLEDAQQSLNVFIQKNPGHRLTQSARNQLGNLLFLRGRLKIEMAQKDNAPALLTAARRDLDEANQVFVAAQNELKEKLAPINERQYDASQQGEADLRDQLRRDYLQALILGAQVVEERANTVAKGTQEFNDLLSEAEKQYQAIEEKYRRLMAAQYAKLYRARCLQKREKFNEALGFLTEILNEQDSADFRPVKTDALQLAMDCWLNPAVKLYAEAVNRGSAWQQTLRPAESREAQPLEIRYKLARAHQLYAEYLREQNPKDRQATEQLRAARDLANDVSRYPSDVQDAARQLLADIRGVDVAPAERPRPKDFAEARAAGKDAIDQMQNAVFLAETLPERLAQESDPQAKADLEKELAEARTNVTAQREEAIQYHQLALTLANRETPPEELTLVRMTLAHLLYLRGDYYDAALLAEFTCRRFPAQAAARDAAKIALAAYVQLYGEAPADSRDFESRHVRSLCDYIVSQWPDQPIAADAWNALIPFVVQDGDFARARTGLESIPADSPQRGEIELKLGRALWASYRQGMTELRKWEKEGVPPGTDLAQRQAQLNEWKAQAEQVLAAGVERLRTMAATIDGARMLAALSLAQVKIETQQAQQAIELLEDPQIGPLTLVRNRHPASETPGVREETFKTALRAYLGTMIAGGDSAESVARAKGIMDELKQAMPADQAGQQRLVATYVGLARDLKAQMEIASTAERQALSQGFELFLGQVTRESSDFQVLNWAGETFFSLAESVDERSAPVAPAASASLYKQAVAVYDKMIAEAEKQAAFLPNPQYMPLLRVKAAMANRRLGKFEAALGALVKILTEKNMTLNVQVEAARTYQMWAAFPGKHELYQRAILGYYPDKNAKPPSNIVWGWGKIGKLTSNRKEFAETFFEARLNLARCRFEYAKRLTDDASRKKYVDLARQDIWFTYRLFPEMGGATWRPQFDSLFREIQQARKEKVVGLEELKQQSATTPASQK